MITVHAGTTVIVSNAFGEFQFPVGQWVVSEVHSLRPGTNPYVQLNLRDGSHISVDTSGYVETVPAADIGHYALQGFILAVGIVGMVMVIRWTLKVFGQVSQLD